MKARLAKFLWSGTHFKNLNFFYVILHYFHHCGYFKPSMVVRKTHHLKFSQIVQIFIYLAKYLELLYASHRASTMVYGKHLMLQTLKRDVVLARHTCSLHLTLVGQSKKNCRLSHRSALLLRRTLLFSHGNNNSWKSQIYPTLRHVLVFTF